MTVTNIALIGVALFAILGAIGAFTIAFRRSQKSPDPTAGVSSETRKADRSLEGVVVTPLLEPESEVEVTVASEVPVPAAVAVAIHQEQRVVEVPVEESGVTRRQFFNRAIGATFFSFLGLMGINSLAFFWPKLSGGFGSDVDAGNIEELKRLAVSPAGTAVPVFIPEGRAYVVLAPPTISEQFEGKQVVADGLMALYQKCVHLGCRVPWCATSIGFECPCHGSKYNQIGEYFGGPAPRNLDRFVVESQDGRLIIKTGSILQTSRAPALSAPYPQGPSCIGAVAEGEA